MFGAGSNETVTYEQPTTSLMFKRRDGWPGYAHWRLTIVPCLAPSIGSFPGNRGNRHHCNIKSHNGLYCMVTVHFSVVAAVKNENLQRFAFDEECFTTRRTGAEDCISYAHMRQKEGTTNSIRW